MRHLTSMIRAKDLTYEYESRDEDGTSIKNEPAIDDINLDIRAGEFIGILGANGSGKSTLAKHINALLIPTGGTLLVDGRDTSDEDNVPEVRRNAGMVFQNPDNQIIGTVVEEDVGFGPENLGVPTSEIWERVEKSLKSVGMYEYRKDSPNKLSGGQKQRVAIAGVMAMRPKCIVLDEATAMLDPGGRAEVLSAVEDLRRQEGVTVIWITHYMDEVIGADRVFVMDAGKVVTDGTPAQVFSRVDLLKKYRLDVPQITLLSHLLREKGLDIPEGILSTKELVSALTSAAGTKNSNDTDTASAEDNRGLKISESPAGDYSDGTATGKESRDKACGEPLLRLEKVRYVYNPGSAYEKEALRDIDLDIYPGEFMGVIGHTGSGKSTLIQHLNGLLKATDGVIYYRGDNIYADKYDMKTLRSHVGLVFQYPEYQLFGEDVLSDVCFGPANQGFSKEESEEKAAEALKLVGLEEKYFRRSPFDLSGGQKRRAAIAGVLAMKPDVLVLDEPTAGLDPAGRDEILDQISYLREKEKITVVLVSHSMEEIAEYVSRIVVLNEGEKLYDASCAEVFSHYKELERVGLSAPRVTYIMHELKARGLPVRTDIITAKDAADEIANVCRSCQRGSALCPTNQNR